MRQSSRSRRWSGAGAGAGCEPRQCRAVGCRRGALKFLPGHICTRYTGSVVAASPSPLPRLADLGLGVCPCLQTTHSRWRRSLPAAACTVRVFETPPLPNTLRTSAACTIRVFEAHPQPNHFSNLPIGSRSETPLPPHTVREVGPPPCWEAISTKVCDAYWEISYSS